MLWFNSHPRSGLACSLCACWWVRAGSGLYHHVTPVVWKVLGFRVNPNLGLGIGLIPNPNAYPKPLWSGRWGHVGSSPGVLRIGEVLEQGLEVWTAWTLQGSLSAGAPCLLSFWVHGLTYGCLPVRTQHAQDFTQRQLSILCWAVFMPVVQMLACAYGHTCGLRVAFK